MLSRGVLSIAAYLPLVLLSTSPAPLPAQDKIVVAATDFMTGFLSTMEAEPAWDTEIDVASIHSDARLRVRDRLIYVVNRLFADNIQCIDPDNGYETVCQVSVGPGSNPSDIIFCSDEKALVPRYDDVWLHVVDLAECAVTDSIYLGDFADGDGLPEMDYGIEVDGRVFVNVQRLDRDFFFSPVPPSYLAVIDCETEDLLDADPAEPGVQGIELLGVNPFTQIQRDPTDGDLLVGTVGLFGSLDGGIERIDPLMLSSSGWMISEQELGGDILAFHVVDAHNGFAVISDAAFNACLVAFDPSSGILEETIFCTEGFNISQHLIAHEGLLFAGDKTLTAPGLRVFDVETRDEIAGPISVGLPPDAMALLRESSTDVTEGWVSAGPLRLGPPHPNPTASAAKMAIHLDEGQGIALGLFDASGRRLRRIPLGWLEAGRHDVLLSERELQGLPSGSYWIRPVGPDLGGQGVRFTKIR